MNLKQLLQAAVLASSVLFGTSASAAAVECGDGSGPYLRVTQVDPGLVNGLCWYSTGNIDNQQTDKGDGKGKAWLDVGPIDILEIGKEVVGQADASSLLDYVITSNSSTSMAGTWSIASSVWNSWQRVFIGFHFGGGQSNSQNPDSFVIELARPDAAGSWALLGELRSDGTRAPIQFNGLSNIYLFAYDACTTNCGGGGDEIPEPATLALVGLGLLGAAVSRRRRRV